MSCSTNAGSFLLRDSRGLTGLDDSAAGPLRGCEISGPGIETDHENGDHGNRGDADDLQMRVAACSQECRVHGTAPIAFRQRLTLLSLGRRSAWLHCTKESRRYAV